MSISTKPASGFRDFLPQEMRLRQRVFRVIQEVYEAYGFEPLETPSFERLDVLLGKYGEEGDQLIFKILHRGEKLERAMEKEGGGELDFAELGLRYDLTVPLARVYAQYQSQLPRFFKRYQLAPVWRADRPQRGRFREFYQCDVDVVGSDSMLAEAEVCGALAEVLRRLEFGGVTIQLNHRLLLRALIERAGIGLEMEVATLGAIDKLDKVGEEGVRKELTERGLSQGQQDALFPLLGLAGGKGGDNEAVLGALRAEVGGLESGKRALEELEQVLAFGQHGPAAGLLRVDPYLARGLSYYTGPIFEIQSADFAGSLGGGGRYDGLIGMFGKQSVPACGFSLGVERILVLMQERAEQAQVQEAGGVDAMVTCWSPELVGHALALAQQLRAEGVGVDVYPGFDKMKRQFKYAHERGAKFVVTVGPEEAAEGVVVVKVMRTGEQVTMRGDEAVAFVRARL